MPALRKGQACTSQRRWCSASISLPLDNTFTNPPPATTRWGPSWGLVLLRKRVRCSAIFFVSFFPEFLLEFGPHRPFFSLLKPIPKHHPHRPSLLLPLCSGWGASSTHSLWCGPRITVKTARGLTHGHQLCVGFASTPQAAGH